MYHRFVFYRNYANWSYELSAYDDDDKTEIEEEEDKKECDDEMEQTVTDLVIAQQNTEAEATFLAKSTEANQWSGKR